MLLAACNSQPKKVLPVTIYISLTESPATKVKQTQDELFFTTLPGFVAVQFISKDSAKQKFIRETGEDFSKVLDINPLPDCYNVTLDANRVEANEYKELPNRIRQAVPHCNDISLPDLDMVKRANN